MFNKTCSVIRSLVLTVFTVALVGQGAWGQTFKVLHSFGNTGDGKSPIEGQVFDSQGNLYGITGLGPSGNGCLGDEGCGMVYRLKPNSDGTWTEAVIHAFNGSDGAYPLSSLLLDAQGNLYGSASGEGHYPDVVYQLTPGSNGTWTESVLYQFPGSPNGSGPGELTFDTAGNLYGTSEGGGLNDTGTVFSLNRSSGWQESLLHTFDGYPYDGGAGPLGSIVFDTEGNLYGTTILGGAYNSGVVYKLTKQGSVFWREKVLYAFTGGSDGMSPWGVVFGPDGSLYRVTQTGGNMGTVSCFGCGTVFKLTPNSDGTWTKTTLYSFRGGHDDGAIPTDRITFDQAGNIYGTTASGGNGFLNLGFGTVYKLTPSSDGHWSESIVYFFTGGSDGFDPDGPLTIDGAGNLYGTAGVGGLYYGGVAYEITP